MILTRPSDFSTPDEMAAASLIYNMMHCPCP